MKKSFIIHSLGPFPIFLILFFLGFLVYTNALFHPFVHDDVVFIEQNPQIADFNLKNIFLKSAGPYVGSSLANVYYRPLLEVLYRLQYKLFGLHSYGYHLVNILLHIGNSFLVYNLIHILVTRHSILKPKFCIGNEVSSILPAQNDAMQKAKWFALTVAVLFLWHPVQTEAVACISGVSNLFFALLFLSSFLGYLSSAYGLSLILFFLSILAKEQAVILPFLLILYQACFPTDSRELKDNQQKKLLGYFAILGGYFFLRKIILGTAFISLFQFKGELWLRLLAIPRTILMYLGVIVFPHDLHYYRSTDILEPFVGPLVLAVVVIGTMGALVRLSAPAYRRLLLFGVGWFFIALLPTLNIIPLINEYSLILTAEHFLYLPVMGIILFAVGTGSDWLNNKKIKGIPVTPILWGMIGVAFAGMTIRQNTYWAGEIPLFQRALKFEKHFGRLHILLGRAYYFQGRYTEAITEHQKALHIMEGYAQKVEDPNIKSFYLGFIKGIHFDSAHCFEALKDFPRAIAEYGKALNLAPHDGVLHNNIGVNYLKIGDIDHAMAHFQKAVALNTDDLMAMNNLAACYLERGENQKAEQLLREVLKRDPQSLPALANLEKLLSSRK